MQAPPPSAGPPPTVGPVALSGPSAAAPQAVPPQAQGGLPAPGTFEFFAARMGRELSRVTPFFRIAGLLIVAGSLLLAAENAIVFTETVGVVQSAQGLMSTPENNTTAQSTGEFLNNTQAYFQTLQLATQLDLIGYTMLGAGAMLVGLGSIGIELRSRFDSTTRRPNKAILVCGALSGVFAMLWVYYTVTWRTQLTGAATGDWSFAPAMFNLNDYIQARGFPEGVTRFLDTFPSVSTNWLLATVMQVPAAVFFVATGWLLKRETGIKIGGLSWVAFSIVALLGTAIFVTAMMGVVMALRSIDFTQPQTLEGLTGDIALQLGVAAIAKLIVVPFYAMVSFLIFSIAGFRLLKIGKGRIVMGDKDLKAILKTPSLPETPVQEAWKLPPEPGAPAGPPLPPVPFSGSELGPAASGGAVATSLPSPPSGDVVVTLGGAPPQPPKK